MPDEQHTHTTLALSIHLSHLFCCFVFIFISRTTAKEIKKKKKYPLLPFRFFLFFSFVTLACCAAARVFDIIITFGLFFFDYFCGLHHLYLLITSFLCSPVVDVKENEKNYSWLCRRVKQTSNVFPIFDSSIYSNSFLGISGLYFDSGCYYVNYIRPANPKAF